MNRQASGGNDELRDVLAKKKLNLSIKRAFDLLVSLIGLFILSLLFVIVAIVIKIDTNGPIFYKQVRVGRFGKSFKIIKFRTMITEADKKGMQITVGGDARITKAGKLLRRSKIDELPQLINIVTGNMSFVGPRPEVPKYVGLYNESQKQVLLVRPGITDPASIKYRNENDILARSSDPERTYIEEIMPAKLDLNLQYIRKFSLINDISVIFKTIHAVLI